MRRNLSLAYSSCPNDTFIFYAMANGRIDCADLNFDVAVADVETLNQDAERGTYDITKLSFAALGHLLDNYGLLTAGSALGRGCGPLIVGRKGVTVDDIPVCKIAVPGMRTTACMLLELFCAERLKIRPSVVPMPFDRIMPVVKRGDFDIGVIIHEGRFTYQQHGLVSLIDLGQWWEQQTSLPIPLGGIAIRRDIDPEVIALVDRTIRNSVEFAFKHPQQTDAYVKKHAQEMDDTVIRKHIALYVNDFSRNIGQEGRTAIEKLFEMAARFKIIPCIESSVFA